MKNGFLKLVGILLVCLLVATLSPLTAAGQKEVVAKDPTKVDLGKSLVLYSSMTENDLTNLLKGFAMLYPEIKVEVVNGSAGELTARITAEKNKPQGDLMWGGLSNSDGMVYSEIFEHWLTQHEADIMPDYRSNNGFYNLGHLSTIVFCVNTELEKKLGLNIKSYKDLLDPRLKGQIVMPDPNSSSSAWNNVCNIMAAYGNDSPEAWAIIEGMMRNNMVISTSSSVAFKSVQSGEYVVGLTYEDGASTLLKSGAKNIRMVYPDEGASASAFGSAVIKGAPHPEAAKAMINYLMSADGQSHLGNALGTLRFTNSKAKYDTTFLPASSEIKWVTRDIDWLIANKKQVLAHWNSLYTSIKR
jgi:iron(III) transport system substrate-binding protein